MKIQTINQLVSVWKDIATRHYQINGFGIGDNWEAGTDKAYMHPVLWINPVSASMPSSDYGYKTFEIDFEIRIFDLVNKDESNENEVLSDTIDILKDIIAEFKGHPYYVNSQLNIIGDIDFEAFTEEFDEEVSGWVTEISLMTPVLTTFCGIPATDITGFEFPGIDCPEVNVLCPVFVEDVTGVYPIVVNTTGTTKEISIVGGGLSDTFVISGNYNDVTDNLELLRNDGVTVLTDLSSVGGGVDTNTFIVSGSFDNTSNNLELTLNDSTVISINLDDLKDNTDTNDYLDTLDFNSNTDNKLTATLSDGSIVDVTIDNFNDLTVNGDVVATAFIGDGSQLTGLASGGDNIANANLTLDDNRSIDFDNKHLTLGGSAPVGNEDFSIQKDTLIKGSDTSEVTSSLKVTDVNEDTTFDIRNNGQIGYGGVYRNLYAHTFRNPNNEANIVSFDSDTIGTESFIIEKNGRFKSQQSGQDILLSYRQSGQSYIKLYDAGTESVRLNKNGSFIHSTLLVGGTTVDSKARLEIQQHSGNNSQQLFFANARMTTAGRLGSSTTFGTAQAGFECYDTTLNKKFFWNGSAWEMITSS
tara:strand:- start:346 stop:2100 length:1755 start_codon:yes stop_codon:yes gene_type:complete